jgi:acetoin utilization deacetylase AcuC-like enzyme
LIAILCEGNGTEEGFVGDDTLFYGSTHEKDNYPGTGIDFSPNVGENAKNPLFRRIVNRYLHAERQTINPNISPNRKEFKVKWREVVDEMEKFSPDLVLISAG